MLIFDNKYEGSPLASGRWVEFVLQRWAGLVKLEIPLKSLEHTLLGPQNWMCKLLQEGFVCSWPSPCWDVAPVWEEFLGSFWICPIKVIWEMFSSQIDAQETLPGSSCQLLTQLLTYFWPKLSAWGYPAKFRSWHRSGEIVWVWPPFGLFCPEE